MPLNSNTEPIRRTVIHPPTIATIAKHMGLSRATVTHVLNGRADEQRIRPETQRRVLEVARELGYRPNASARSVRAGRFGNVALIQSLAGQYLPLELLQGLTQAVAKNDMHLVLSHVADIAIDEEVYLPRTMRELSVDGVLINRHVGLPETYLSQIQRLRIPAISINVRQDVDCVHPDEVMAGRLATEFLLNLRHEQIAFVDAEVAEDPHFSKHDRRQGYEQAMSQAGKAPWVYVLPDDWYGIQQTGIDQRIEAAIKMLAREDRPSAIVAYELTEAMAVVHAAEQSGLQIPQDLSVILFHHRIDDRYFLPFHTVTNVMEEVGTEAVAMLLKKIDAPEAPLPTQVIPARLQMGATCAQYSASR